MKPLKKLTTRFMIRLPKEFTLTQEVLLQHKKHKGVLKNLKKVRKNIPLKVVKNTHNGGKIV